MRKIRFFIFVFMLLALISLPTSEGITPDNQVIGVMIAQQYPVHYGSGLNITVLIQNYGNHTLKDLTLYNKIRDQKIRLVSTPYGDVPSEREPTTVASNTTGVPGTRLNPQDLFLKKLVVNGTIINATFAKLEVNQTLEFWFTIRAVVGAGIDFPAMTVKWIDPYGDVLSIKTNALRLRYRRNVPEDVAAPYILYPDGSFADNYRLLMYVTGGVILLALISQFLYFEKKR